MKFYKKEYLAVLVMLLSGVLTAQAQKQETDDIFTHSKISTYDLRSRDLVGSMYINEKPEIARISNNEKLYPMRYNAYQNEMEFQRDGKSYFIPKNVAVTVTFENLGKIYRAYTYVEKGKEERGFFVVSYEGAKISVLTRERINFFESEKPKTGYDKFKPPTLKRIKDKLYIGYVNGMTAELPNKKKDILSLFSSKSEEIEKYAKRQKLGFKKTEDLVAIFKYYDSLN